MCALKQERKHTNTVEAILRALKTDEFEQNYQKFDLYCSLLIELPHLKRGILTQNLTYSR